jgi:hypothetical protein
MRTATEDSARPQSLSKRHLERVQTAPIGGWCADKSIAEENPGCAEVLENWIPTTRGVRARGGSRKIASIGLFPVESFLNYTGTSTNKLFAAMAGAVYDVTNPASPVALISPVFSGQTSNFYSSINFSITAGDFLLAFNGDDLHKVYNGAVWATNLPAITGVSSASITQAAVHASRIWMVEKNSKRAWYLPVDAIGGVALDFSLEGIFKRGGKLLDISTWSQDSGSGSSDRVVFRSDQGEVAVYGGDYPGGTWQLFGVYNIPKLLGKDSFLKIGGDILSLAISGIVPMSEVTQKDPAALSLSAITRFIEPYWKKLTSSKADKPWSFVKWDERNIGIVSVPSNTQTRTGTSIWGSTFIWGQTPWGSSYTIEETSEVPQCLVVNLQTGRWCRVTGWDCRSMVVFNGKFIFGTSSGTIHYGDEGGNDDGTSYECRLAYWPSRYGYDGEKQFLQAAGVFEHSTSFNARITISANNQLTWAAPPAPPPEDGAEGAWGTALWGIATWGAEGEKRVTYEKWVSLGRRGRVGAIMLQATFNNVATPDVEFTDVTVTYERAAVVVS